MADEPKADLLDHIDPVVRARAEAERQLSAALREERLKIEAATREAHEVLQALIEATRRGQEQIRSTARAEANKQVSRALARAGEIIRGEK